MKTSDLPEREDPATETPAKAENFPSGKTCPRCAAESGDSWACPGDRCPMPMSPHYDRMTDLHHQGLSWQEAERAVQVADERFDGDLRLGARFVHASQFAVMVYGDRDAWNEAWARRGS